MKTNNKIDLQNVLLGAFLIAVLAMALWTFMGTSIRDDIQERKLVEIIHHSDITYDLVVSTADGECSVDIDHFRSTGWKGDISIEIVAVYPDREKPAVLSRSVLTRGFMDRGKGISVRFTPECPEFEIQIGIIPYLNGENDG